MILSVRKIMLSKFSVVSLFLSMVYGKKRKAENAGNYTGKNSVISPDLLVWKFCGKTQFPHSFGRIVRSQELLFNHILKECLISEDLQIIRKKNRHPLDQRLLELHRWNFLKRYWGVLKVTINAGVL